MCGGSVFKAAREDSKESKKYDETGLVISSCKHCICPCAINTFKGESFTHSAFMHNGAMKRHCKFFCYDVVCRYWKWIKKVSLCFPEYAKLIKNMGGFLPRMHAKAHHWPCQVNSSWL